MVIASLKDWKQFLVKVESCQTSRVVGIGDRPRNYPFFARAVEVNSPRMVVVTFATKKELAPIFED